MTRRRELALWIVALLFMLACVIYGTWQCGKRLAQAIQMGQEQGEGE